MTSSKVVGPDDVVSAAVALLPLAAIPDDAEVWFDIAEPTTWTAVRTMEHISDALLFYGGQVARRANRRLPVLRNGRSGTPSEHLDNALSSAHLLGALLRDLGTGRAFHPSGLADAAGWAGMAVTELLVHGSDVARTMGVSLDLPRDVCTRTVARVFPWIDASLADPAELLLAVAGRAEVEGIRPDPQWWWQSAPLAEWDGQPRRRDVEPGWS